MSGSPKTLTEPEAILKALKQPPKTGYFVWDGVEEDERPATAEELKKGLMHTEKNAVAQLARLARNR